MAILVMPTQQLANIIEKELAQCNRVHVLAI